MEIICCDINETRKIEHKEISKKRNMGMREKQKIMEIHGFRMGFQNRDPVSEVRKFSRAGNADPVGNQ